MKTRWLFAQIKRDTEERPHTDDDDEHRQEDDEDDAGDGDGGDGDDEDEDEADDDEGTRTFTFIASTDVEDRMGDIVEQDFDLADFKANPVILWAHRNDLPPIGRAVSIRQEKGKLVIDIKFDTEQELGALVARQVDEGFLNAVSVGFIPGEVLVRSMLPEDDPRHADFGLVFRRNTLLETSVVPVPANQEALAERNQALVAKGLPKPGDTDGLDREEVRALVMHLVKTDAGIRTYIKGLILAEKSIEPPPDELETWFSEGAESDDDDSLSKWFAVD